MSDISNQPEQVREGQHVWELLHKGPPGTSVRLLQRFMEEEEKLPLATPQQVRVIIEEISRELSEEFLTKLGEYAERRAQELDGQPPASGMISGSADFQQLANFISAELLMRTVDLPPRDP